MSRISTEVIFIAILILLNGLFAMAEMALASSRKARLRQFADKGDLRAKKALDLAESPNRFLSTVQIGITLIGILAGAIGGARLSETLGGWMEPFLGEPGKKLAFFVVVLVITYLSLLIGELVPKRLALRNPERTAMFFAGPMQRLARFASPIVHFLGVSTEAILKILHIGVPTAGLVTEEEVAGLVQEGLEAGVLYQAEGEMVHSVLALDRLRVDQIMTPRPRIVWLDANDPHELAWHKIVISHHSHFPVYEGSPDHVLGFLSVKSLYANLAAGVPTELRDLVTPALIVPETQSPINLLETFKTERRHIALVTDEYGSISGIVTINDILEAIVGDMPDATTREPTSFIEREDGSILVDALVGIEEVEEFLAGFKVSPEEGHKYSTLGGFVCDRLAHIPREGEHFNDRGYRFEVVDMDRQRVDKVLVSRLPHVPEEESVDLESA